jgi:hypothetical protein
MPQMQQTAQKKQSYCATTNQTAAMVRHASIAASKNNAKWMKQIKPVVIV